MREEKFQLFQLITQGVTALGTIGVAISICVTIYSVKEAQEWNRQAHEWNRRSYTVDMIRDFDGHVAGYRVTLQESFPGMFRHDQHGLLEPGTAESLWLRQAEPNSKYEFMRDQKKVEQVRNQLIGLLNYLEYVAQSYNESVVDQEAFENSLADPMIAYHDFLIEFIKVSQKHVGYANWQPITRAVDHIKDKRRGNVSGPKPPTGM